MFIPLVDLSAMHAEIERELDQAWQKVSRSAHFIGGEAVERFESAWAGYCGARHCVGVASGTVALQLSLAALGIGPGDEVIVPANTFFATAEAVLAVGADPVFVDVSPATLLVTASGVQEAITPRTAAVIAVHLYGQPADMDAIGQVAAAAGIAVLEDAAQAHGAKWQGRRVGSLSHAGCFSFYPAKNLGAFGDAGAVVTNDADLAERVRSLSDHGRHHGERHRHDQPGGTHRLDALHAAILSVKLERLDSWNAARRQAAEWYATLLAGLPVEPVRTAPGACSSHHLMVIRTPRREHLRRRLAAHGIATEVHYPIPCHRQPAFEPARFPELPVAETAAGRIVSLPMHPCLPEDDVKRIAAMINDALVEP